MTALLIEIIPSCLELRVSYDWQATAVKLSPERNTVSFGHFLGFSHNNCVYIGCGTYGQATPKLLNADVKQVVSRQNWTPIETGPGSTFDVKTGPRGGGGVGG